MHCSRKPQIRFVAAAAFLLCLSTGQAADCSGTSTGFIPIPELGADLHQGFPGGLYPSGQNERPQDHDAAGRKLASDVAPRDAHGNPDPGQGKIGLLSIGMSNTTQEFSVFQKKSNRDPKKNPQLVLVDGAQGGQSAGRIVTDGERYWATVEQRLRGAGVTAAQVQVAWMKQANPRPTGAFPKHARRLQADLAEIARTLRFRFPQLRLLYLSSRIYAGYASTPLNPEPFAYQSGFAAKWLIEEQIQGSPELSYEKGQAPWMAWGPYLWADGVRPRQDGLTWSCSDFGEDGTHPGEVAREKVASLLLDFFKSDATTRGWFLVSPSPGR